MFHGIDLVGAADGNDPESDCGARLFRILDANFLRRGCSGGAVDMWLI
jgi:hypothetical protein